MASLKWSHALSKSFLAIVIQIDFNNPSAVYCAAYNAGPGWSLSLDK